MLKSISLFTLDTTRMSFFKSPAFWWTEGFVLSTGVFRGLTKGLVVVLEHFDCIPLLGDWGPEDIGVKLKFFLLVFGLGGTASSPTDVSKLTLLLMFIWTFETLIGSIDGATYATLLCTGVQFRLGGFVNDALSVNDLLSKRFCTDSLVSTMPFCKSCLSVDIFEMLSVSTVLLFISLLLKYLESSSSCWLLLVPVMKNTYSRSMKLI